MVTPTLYFVSLCGGFSGYAWRRGLRIPAAGYAALPEVQGGQREYGSADDPKQFAYLRLYSPYQNVHSGAKYPAVMFISGDFDTRVDPLHARKMAAPMQASTGSDRPILPKYDTRSGHSGGKPVNRQFEDDADWLSFLMKETGL